MGHVSFIINSVLYFVAFIFIMKSILATIDGSLVYILFLPYQTMLIVFLKIKSCFEFKYTTQSKNNLTFSFSIFTVTILLSCCVS